MKRCLTENGSRLTSRYGATFLSSNEVCQRPTEYDCVDDQASETSDGEDDAPSIQPY